MAIASLTDLHAALAGRQRYVLDKSASGGTNSEATSHSMWFVVDDAGVWPAGATPVSETLDRTSLGAMPLPAAETGKKLYLAGLRLSQMSTSSEDTNQLVIADRLSQVGGLVGNVTTEQAVNTPALPRHTSGEKVQAWIEIRIAVGSTVTSVAVSYTNQAGVAGRTGAVPSFGSAAFNDATSMMRVNLQEGDTGVRSVESVTLAATTGTAGSVSVVLGVPIVRVWRGEFQNTAFDWADLGLPEIDPNAALWLFTAPETTNRAEHMMTFDWIQG